jgi:hypothetical protein
MMHPHAKWVMDVKWYVGWKLLIWLLIFEIIGCECPMRKNTSIKQPQKLISSLYHFLY